LIIVTLTPLLTRKTYREVLFSSKPTTVMHIIAFLKQVIAYVSKAHN